MQAVTGADASVRLEHAVAGTSWLDALLLRLLVPVATMLTIGAVSLLLLFTPVYLHLALDAAGAPQVLGMSPATTYDYSDRTVSELFFGPATFDFAAPDGRAFYSVDERAHMRDVRTVLYGFLLTAAVAVSVLAVVALRWRANHDVLRAIGRGGAILAVATLVIGVFAAVAFDTAFELFHRLLFPGGNFTFDPSTQRLVQLYPFAFWQLTAAALGGLLVVGGAATWLIARRRRAPVVNA